MEIEKLKKSAFCIQLLATLIIANLSALTGFVNAWPSYTYTLFRSNGTVLDSPMTIAEFSLLGSLSNIGGFLSTPFCGYAVDKFGRKYSAMMYGLPFVIAWGIIAVTKSVNLVIFAAGLAGIGAGGQAVSSVYISEICHDSIRGGLTSSTIDVFFIGLIFSYTLGALLSYYSVVYVHLVLSILYVVLLTLLKESPIFLLKCGKEKVLGPVWVRVSSLCLLARAYPLRHYPPPGALFSAQWAEDMPTEVSVTLWASYSMGVNIKALQRHLSDTKETSSIGDDVF